ncbi:MAG: hypothetical protein FWF15_02015 [Oscillospiraceae bacterium]|nr:hypothetical protein [Oscillospiraceae bacterium]
MRGNITNVDLVDIRDVTVDKNLPKQIRIAEYIRQIKNPRKFKCGEFVVTSCFPENGPTLEDCLRGMLV